LKRLVESEAESDLQAISVKLRLDETRSLSLTPQNETSLYFFNPIEPFLLRIKVILLTGILAALPIILWNVWKFVSPGLTDQERRLVRRGLQGALFLFPAGVLFAYYSVGFAIYFLLQYGEGFVPAIGIVAYLNMVLLYMVVMGLVFEFPLVLLLLVSMGVINTSALAANRPYVLLGLLVFSAILTPPEPFTMLLMAAPLYFLFEISLMMARVIERRTQKPRTDSE
jgi:sec-independent protein translocase protein TatC